MATITYFFTILSPWSYIGHAAFARVAADAGVAIDYRPMSLLAIFPESGGLPLAKRHPSRQAYRMLELRRWILKRGLPMNPRPRHWPFDAALADKIIVAIVTRGGDVERILPRFFSGVFEREEDLADERFLARLLAEAGFEADAVMNEAKSEVIAAAYEANAADALREGVFGAPTYRLEGELFWGQDRLPLLADALTSGRAPFRADV